MRMHTHYATTCFQLNTFHLNFQIQQNHENQMALGKIYKVMYFQLPTYLLFPLGEKASFSNLSFLIYY